jgi:hypothetical protein
MDGNLWLESLVLVCAELWYLAEIRLPVRDPQHVPRVQGCHRQRCHHPVLQVGFSFRFRESDWVTR